MILQRTLRLDGRFSFSFATDTPTYRGPTSFVGSTATSAVAEISLDPNNFTAKQRLTYTLEVTDDNGTAEDTVTVVIIPSVAPPIPVVEVFPRRPFYRGGEVVELDGAFSFHPDGLALSYEWKILGSASFSGSATSSVIALELPQVASDTKIKAKVTVTDTLGKSASQDVVLRVRAKKRPPIASVEPEFIVLQSADEPEEIGISGLDLTV